MSQNTILWKVSDTINAKTSYLVGTFHQFGNSFVDSIPEIKNSLLNSELAVFESLDTAEENTAKINSREASNKVEKKLKEVEFQSYVKKTIQILFLAVMALGLSACGKTPSARFYTLSSMTSQSTADHVSKQGKTIM